MNNIDSRWHFLKAVLIVLTQSKSCSSWRKRLFIQHTAKMILLNIILTGLRFLEEIPACDQIYKNAFSISYNWFSLLLVKHIIYRTFSYKLFCIHSARYGSSYETEDIKVFVVSFLSKTQPSKLRLKFSIKACRVHLYYSCHHLSFFGDDITNNN